MNTRLYKKIPAHVLVEDFMVPHYLDVKDVARIARINPIKMHKFIRGEQRIDEVMAAKLGHMFNTSRDYWLAIQARYDRDGSL